MTLRQKARKTVSVRRGAVSRLGETFRVEYLYYVLLVLALAAVFLVALRIPGRGRLAGRPEDLASRASRRRERERQKEAARDAGSARRHAVLERELKHVPTPWGWPGSDLHGAGKPDLADDVEIAHSGAVRRWLDHLVAEKRTVHDENFRQRREASLKALLEDRYGRRIKPSEMAYRKVKPPRLRDPSLPHDQMDNFPSGKTDQIVSGLEEQPRQPEPRREMPLRKTGSLKEVKTPWGW